MRSDLVKAAAVLGASLVLGAGVLVLGMRWAIASGTQAHLRELERMNGAVAAASAHVGERVDTSATRVAGTLETSSAHVADTVGGTGQALRETVLLGFERPFLIRAPDPLPVGGSIGVEGLDGGQAMNVAATIGRNEGNGDERSERNR